MEADVSRSPTWIRTARGCLVACSALALSGVALAADHADSPSQRVDGAQDTDINDLYAFMNPDDADELVLVLTVSPNADESSTFATDATYNFLIENGTAFNDEGTDFRLTCSFPSTTEVTCNLGDITVGGAVGATHDNADGGLRVYTGLRDDPFYFNGPGLTATFQEPPMPRFQEAIPEGGQANSFAGQNILAIVVGVDRDLLDGEEGAAPVMKIWASTEPASAS